MADSPIWQPATDVEYKTLDRGMGAWAVKTGPGAIAPIPLVPGSTTVQETFDTLPLWNQITFGGNSGTGVWATATDSFHSSPKSFKSPALSSGQTSTFTIFNDTFDPQVSFWMRVDGGNPVGPLLDGVTVKVDGVTVLTVSDFDTGWVRYALNIGFGYQIDFTYDKGHAAFTDRAWIDNIVFGSLDIPAVPGSPAHPLVYAPMHLTDDNSLLIAPDATKMAALSSLTPLTGNASFTSPWMPVTLVNAIRIGVFSDQSGTLFTQHSDDGGATIVRNSSQPVTANLPEYLSFYPRNSYFRLVYTNGAAAQSFFHLETVFHTVPLTPTQSLVSAKLGRQSLALQERAMLYDYEMDEVVGVAPQIRDLFTVQRTSLIADNFRQTTDLDTQTWTETNTGTGNSQVTNGRLEMSTGVTANSTTRVESTTKGRFISGSHQVFRAGVKLADAGVANSTMRWGSYDDVSGYFFELSGTTLSAVSRRASTDTKVAAASWNTISTFALAAAGGSNRFEIAYFGNTALFIVNGETHHQMSGEVGGLPRTNGTNFPNRFENINSGGSTTNRLLVITGTSQQRYGPDQVVPRMTYLSGAGTTTIKSDAGNLHRVSILDGSGANTATLYDNTAGSGVVIGVLNVNKLSGTLEFGGVFNTGLTVVTTGADTKLSVVFD